MNLRNSIGSKQFLMRLCLAHRCSPGSPLSPGSVAADSGLHLYLISLYLQNIVKPNLRTRPIDLSSTGNRDSLQLRQRIEKEMQVHCEFIFSKHSAAMNKEDIYYIFNTLRYLKIYSWIKQRQLRIVTWPTTYLSPNRWILLNCVFFLQDAISLY